ncbi:hypothetical protein EJB05_07371 [Eragrostis curvula]|uniref:ACB domain-containing protein n=1 Tax=Eragrostis curvula TaxID=38414 RepID=A0A5J9WGC0_9POAL|nr:hypothetical protein EJB05_07371 [Eragrostis curvula]
MALLFELLLTAVVTLLAAFLLATLFAANDPRREPDRAAAAIAEEVAEEERIIEVDEVKRSERTAAAEAEGWVEVEKAPAVVVEEAECSPEPDKEVVPVKAALAVRPGAGLEEEEVDVGEKRCDLTAAASTPGVVVEADTHAVVAEAVPREVVDVAGSESGRVQDVGAKQHDLPAEAAPSEVLDAQQEKQGVQRVAEVLPIKLEAVEAEHHHLVSEVAPAAEVLDAGLEEDSVQVIEVKPDELAAETAPEQIPDVVSEKKGEQTVEAEGNELTAEAVPEETFEVPLAEKEEPKIQQPVEEAVDTHEEVQNREEAECETHPVDQQEELVPEEELVATKRSDAEVTHEGSSSDKLVDELPVEVVTLQGPPEDDAESDMDIGDWEGIERSEVEKKFGAAATFAASEAGAAALSKLGSDVQVQLQGLLKVAIDGPCYDSTQPLTLRPSSRAKWVAWQKLGNMHPEIAMEKYMNLLSEVIPGWLRYETSDTKKHEADDYFEGSTLTMTAASDQQRNRGNEESTGIYEGHLTASPNPEKGQSSNIPAE